MNFSLDGGWMLAIVVLLWLLVYVPNWGSRGEQKIQGSSSGRNFSQKSRLTAKNSVNGVSQTKNIDKKFSGHSTRFCDTFARVICHRRLRNR
jgi:hypothetical protein